MEYAVSTVVLLIERTVTCLAFLGGTTAAFSVQNEFFMVEKYFVLMGSFFSPYIMGPRFGPGISHHYLASVLPFGMYQQLVSIQPVLFVLTTVSVVFSLVLKNKALLLQHVLRCFSTMRLNGWHKTNGRI